MATLPPRAPADLLAGAQRTNAQFRDIAAIIDQARCPRCGGHPIEHTPDELLRRRTSQLHCVRCNSSWYAPIPLTASNL